MVGPSRSPPGVEVCDASRADPFRTNEPVR